MKRKVKIAAAQMNCKLADIEANLENHYVLIEKAIGQQCNLIQFPELSLTGYSLKDAVFDTALMDSDSKWDKLKELSKHISIVVGGVELNKRFEIYNTLFYFEDGKLLSKHRKVYLPTYGLFEEKRYFSSGNRFRAFDSKWGRLGLLICEDMWHPTSGVILAQDGASILLVSSAGISRGMDTESRPENVQAWEALNRSLSIQTTSYMTFVNRVGVEDGLTFWGGSEFISPHGHRIGKASYFKEELLIGEVDFLKLKHARINTTLLSDEKLTVVIDELSRIQSDRKKY